MFKDKINKFLSDKYNKIFLAILITAALIRLYFLFSNPYQPLWWDESEYANKAKSIAFNTEYNDLWSPRKPILLPLLSSIIFKIFESELMVKLLIVIFSLITISMVYFIGKKIYEKKIALIATLFMSVLWLDIFFSNRLLTDVPSAALVALTMFSFIKAKENNNYFYLLGILIALSYLMRVANIMLIGILLINLLITERLSFLKNKKIWTSAIITAVIIGSYFIWLFTNYENVVERLATLGEGVTPPFISSLFSYLSRFPSYLTIPFLITFLFGLIPMLINVILGFDIMLKGKDKELTNSSFLLAWILPYLLFYGLILPNVEDRFLLPIFLPISLITANGLFKISDIIKNYNKDLAKIVIALLIISGIILQLIQTNNLIESKKDSYLIVKEAALWIKQNSNPTDLVISNSLPQNIYYSERNTTYFNSKQEFEDFIKVYKPKYMVASIFEQSYDWYYKYPEDHKDTVIPVQAYFADQQKTQSILIIYLFRYQ